MKQNIILLLLILFCFSTTPLMASPIEEQVEIEANILPYTNLSFTDDSFLFRDSLSGEVGLYLSDGRQVRSKALDHFNLHDDDDVVNHDNVPGIKFLVETNYNANIKVESDFDWGINSPSAFLIFEHWDPWEMRGKIYKNDDENYSKETNFNHSGNIGEEKEYKIGGAIFIENIYDQESGVYDLEIVVTVEKADN